MRRIQRIVLLVTLVAVAPVLAGCENFDMDKFDIFGMNDKKKLPGERKPVFPEGVPGVSQGIPPEFMKGNQPPPENADITPLPAEPAKTAAAAPVDEPKPKPKRKKPRTAAAPRQPASQNQGAEQAPAPWPSQPAQPQGQSSSTAPWPASPAPGTFQR